MFPKTLGGSSGLPRGRKLAPPIKTRRMRFLRSRNVSSTHFFVVTDV